MNKHTMFQVAASVVTLAAVIFIPQVHNGQRDWFTQADVVAWIHRTGNVMPVSCDAFNGSDTAPLFHECTVVQAKPLKLVWDNGTHRVEAVVK